MLVWLAEYLVRYETAFNAISYITVRAILALLTALFISLWIGPKVIKRLQILKFGQEVRNDGPESHFAKKGTPTMGGVMILFSIGVSTLLWANLTNPYVWICLFVLFGYGAIGFVDDFRKITRKNTDGLIARWKYFWTGNVNFAEYLHIPYIKYSSEVVVFCTAIVGAGLGFLWFNTYPAQVFMGDVGSLALGGALGVVAILVRQEFLLVIMGGVFVVEALSVILQVGSYKLRKQRIFRMAPIHHHFELKGWPEPRVIIRFWIISLMLVLMGLVTLKLR